VLQCRFRIARTGSICLSTSRRKPQHTYLSRRQFLQYCEGASLAFLPAGVAFGNLFPSLSREAAALPSELQLHPQYRSKPALEAILQKVPAASDKFVTEKYQDLVAAILSDWRAQLLRSPQDVTALARVASADFSANSLSHGQLRPVGINSPLQPWRVQFSPEPNLAKDEFFSDLRDWLRGFSKLFVAEFQIVRIHAEPLLPSSPGGSQQLLTTVRFELVGTGEGFHREQRVGHWELRWEMTSSSELRLLRWQALEETRCRAPFPVFVDITALAFARNPSYAEQLLPGTDYWRTVLDGACGIDIYGHNGVSVADYDGDGLDDLYICQPAGLPNRLFRNRGGGTFDDVTESAGVGVLENTSCALFADIDNDGRQDLIVVCASGPILFLNQGNGKFRAQPNAFRFASPPQGTFTGAAIADYDRDGWLDIYFCLYSFYQGADQYRYPTPYFDAENGPPNFLLRNNRDGTFHDVTKQSGLDVNNTRFSFCCAWCDFNGDLWPDLYVVNDFGRKNLYRNNGHGTFTDVAGAAGVENIGAGMSISWLDFDNDGRQDLYVADMWTAAGLRISSQENFQKNASPEIRQLYQQHAMGNSLFRNLGEKFEDVTKQSGTAMGRWSWSSDSWDFNHDGYPDLYIANGMISGHAPLDLNSFFWRQVVADSPNEPQPSHAYEQAWNAINELIRSDGTWSGFERNVFYLNNRDGTFSDVSGIVGLDSIEDSRTFALADFDRDGRLEVVLKNRNSPQLRFFKNVLPELPPSISFRLTGNKSNRDAIGARITVETSSGRQTRALRAGSGFLAQHTKEIFFGLGPQKSPVQAVIEWPSGFVQKLHDLSLNHRIWVEEGSAPSRFEPFEPFLGVPANEENPAHPTPEVLPDKVETWLLVPVLAPGFSLPDQSNRTQTLFSYRGIPVLLYFWSNLVSDSRQALGELVHFHKDWARDGLQLVAINVDAANVATAGASHSQVPSRAFSFPVLQASPDVIATYNLLFRQLFDRHRDMSVPISFLLDPASQIVKIYQGALPMDRVTADFKNIPQTDAQHLAKALPFPGLTQSYNFGRNYLSLGFVFYDHSYFDQAEIFYRQAASDDPQSAEALYGLGSARLQLQKTHEARRDFERALKLHASYPGTIPNCWNNLGLLSARAGDTDLAIQDFLRALEIDPQHPIALLNLGVAYRQKKDWPQAQKILERALALAPDDPEVNYNLGMVFAQQNDAERASQYLQKAIAFRPPYPEALNNLGILYLRTHRTADAIRSFEESIRVAPDYDQSYLSLARVYVIQGQREKARAILQELLKQHPGHPQATSELQQINP
jgi:tetratricopeptide (TPR) repeat protein